MKYEIISTGSKGNAVVIDDRILIDCGVPFKAIEPYLKKIKLILLTHEHSDHINTATVKRIAFEKPNIRFACGKWLARKLLDAGVKAQNIDICRMNRGYTYGGIIIAPFELYHDVPNCGWRIMLPDGKRIFYATDTGSLDGIEAKGYDLYFIEANHTEDEIAEKIAEKQANGEYAYEVRAAHTHLSKEQADRFIIENAKATSEFIYLHMHSDATTATESGESNSGI